VNRPRRFSLCELLAFPKREVTAFHQCAGFPLAPHIATRRLANVVWGGVDLAMLLETVEVQAEASHLWSFGVESGRYEDVEASAYVKDLPLERLPSGDILLAYEMNGEPLTKEHGFPLRLVVPGFYGTNSVKWLYRLELAPERHRGLYTAKLYNDPIPGTAENPAGGMRPVWEIAPESFVVWPAPDERIDRTEKEIWGWAWGAAEIDQVEVSTDGGLNWQVAGLSRRVQRSWQRFKIRWKPEGRGTTTILSRATDVNGVRQAAANARNAIYSVVVHMT
jgi:DMSO/TMAO reductase YedYZ molybdopterin-dependent catalytic subunit